jgi:hypothetical protein
MTDFYNPFIVIVKPNLKNLPPAQTACLEPPDKIKHHRKKTLGIFVKMVNVYIDAPRIRGVHSDRRIPVSCVPLL